MIYNKYFIDDLISTNFTQCEIVTHVHERECNCLLKENEKKKNDLLAL